MSNSAPPATNTSTDLNMRTDDDGVDVEKIVHISRALSKARYNEGNVYGIVKLTTSLYIIVDTHATKAAYAQASWCATGCPECAHWSRRTENIVLMVTYRYS